MRRLFEHDNDGWALTYRNPAVAPFNIKDDARMRAEVRCGVRFEMEENIGVKFRVTIHVGE